MGGGGQIVDNQQVMNSEKPQLVAKGKFQIGILS